MPSNQNAMPIIGTFTKKAEFILATPQSHHKSELEPRKAAFIEGLGNLKKFSFAINALSWGYARGIDPERLGAWVRGGAGAWTWAWAGAGDPLLFGLFAHVIGLAPYAHQFMPLNPLKARALVVGLMKPLVSLISGHSKLTEDQLEQLWEAFRSGPALHMPLRLAKKKGSLTMDVISQWPPSG